MKNKYNMTQIAQVYCEEIGVNVPFMEEYLMAVFQKGKLDKEKIADFDRRLKDMIVTNSEYFPEWG